MKIARRRTSYFIQWKFRKKIRPNVTSTAQIISFESSSTTLKGSESENDKTMEMQTSVHHSIQSPLARHKKMRYVGDLGSSDFSSPTRAKKGFHLMKKVITGKKKKIKLLQGTVRRLRKKITDLNSLLALLKEKLYISESSEETIRASLEGPAKVIFERMLKGPTSQKYDPVLRSFALTLAFYSPRAYNYVRETFNKSLPHLGTISKWYRSIDGSPGFTQEALEALKLKHQEAIRHEKHILCNLVFDEMSIRQQSQWTGTEFTGFVNIGTEIDSDKLPEAKGLCWCA